MVCNPCFLATVFIFNTVFGTLNYLVVLRINPHDYVIGAFKFKLPLKIKCLSELPVDFTQEEYFKLNKNTIVRKEKTKITDSSSYTEAIVANGFHTCYFKISKELKTNLNFLTLKKQNSAEHIV